MADLISSEAFERVWEEAMKQELLRALPILQEAAKVADWLDVTGRNLAGAAIIRDRLKKNLKRVRPYRPLLVPEHELPEDEEAFAPGITKNTKKALDSIDLILEKAVDSIFDVLESTTGREARYAAQLLVDRLTRATEKLLLYAKRPSHPAIRRIAMERVGFPSVISLSRKITNDYEDSVRNLSLGRRLPFRVDPRTTYTPYTRLAMQIVSFINVNRRRKDSIYRKFIPDLHEKDFVQKHSRVWDKVIGFHLDAFQSPRSRRMKLAEQHFGTPVRDVLESRLSAEEKRNYVRSSDLNPFGAITAMLEFRYRDGKKVTIKREGEFYNRVKHKVIDAALALMPK
jgi:hypothetical protein